jgi:hypothetical protein
MYLYLDTGSNCHMKLNYCTEKQVKLRAMHLITYEYAGGYITVNQTFHEDN